MARFVLACLGSRTNCALMDIVLLDYVRLCVTARVCSMPSLSFGRKQRVANEL